MALVEKISTDLSTQKEKLENSTPVLFIYEKTIYKFDQLGKDNWKNMLKLLYNIIFENQTSEDLEFIYSMKIGDCYKFYKKHEKNTIKITNDTFLYWKITKRTQITTLRSIADRLNSKRLQIFITKTDNLETDYKNVKSEIKKIIADKQKNKTKYQITKVEDCVQTIDLDIFPKEKVLNDNVKKLIMDRKSGSNQFKYKFLGDIELDEDKWRMIDNYLKFELKRFKYDSIDDPKYMYLFIIGLIHFARENYKDKFFPLLKEKYDVSFSPPTQGAFNTYIMNCFRWMKRAPYDLEGNIISELNLLDTQANSFEYLCMHNFVTDKCAGKVFEKIFAFWKLYLDRDYRKLKERREFYNSFIDKIQTQYIPVHTRLAIILNKFGSKARIRNIIRRMDLFLYNNAQYELLNKDKRVFSLLDKWLNENSLIKKEIKYVKENNYARGGKLHHNPYITYKGGKFFVEIPQQRMKEMPESGMLNWKVLVNDNLIYNLDTEVKDDKVLFYASSSIREEIQLHQLFGKVTIKADFADKTISRIYNKNSILVFGYDFRMVSFSDYLYPGYYNIFVKDLDGFKVNGKRPEHIYSQGNLGIFRIDLDLVEGDVITTNIAEYSTIICGNQIKEGLLGRNTHNNAVILHNSIEYPIYSSYPKYYFKCKKDEISGIWIIISKNGVQKNYPLKELSYEYVTFETKGFSSGCIVDLASVLEGAAVYDIAVDIANLQQKYVHEAFAYIKDFDYKLNKKQYVFEETGKVSLFGNIKIDKEKYTMTNNDIPFKIFGMSDYEEVIDGSLAIDVYLKNELFTLKLNLPILYWKVKEDDEWSPNKLPEVSKKNYPRSLYFKRSNFLIDSTISYDDLDNDVDDDISDKREATQTLIHDSFLYDLNYLSSVCDDRSEYKKIILNLKNDEIVDLFILRCKTIIKSASIFYDRENQGISGDIVLIGDSKCTVKIYKNNKEITDSMAPISLQSNKFFFPYEIENYNDDIVFKVSIYEKESLFKSKIIYTKELKLLNNFRLSGQFIKITNANPFHNFIGYTANMLKLEKILERLDFVTDIGDDKIIYEVYPMMSPNTRIFISDTSGVKYATAYLVIEKDAEFTETNLKIIYFDEKMKNEKSLKCSQKGMTLIYPLEFFNIKEKNSPYKKKVKEYERNNGFIIKAKIEVGC